MKHLKFIKSLLCKESSVNSTDDILEWIKRRNREVLVDVKEVPFNALEQWYTDPQTGNIKHQSGKFFTIEGVAIQAETNVHKAWSQPIIHQPEVGFLGFLVKEINGVLHFLVQAKIEPGNVNNVQLSPTIQATRSNYMQVHKGKSPAYLDYFKYKKGVVLVDQLQSEQGARFFKKRNRNIIIEVTGEVPLADDFMWVTLGQLKTLLRYDNIVNMDTRTVISAISYGTYYQESLQLLNLLVRENAHNFGNLVFNSYLNGSVALHQTSDIHSWLTELKSTYELAVNLIDLNKVEHWCRDEHKIYHEKNKYFEVIAVNVRISSREVAQWSQPIIKPCQEGIVAFIAKIINGVLHFLVQAKVEVGNMDVVELAPTVQCITGNYREGQNEYTVPYLEYVLNARKEQIMHDVLLSEEGGRFYRNQNRNMILLADDKFDEIETQNYRWLTLNQMMHFMEFNNYLNIEARSLLSVLSF